MLKANRVVAAIAVLLLAGCGGGGGGTSVSTSSTTPTIPVTPVQTVAPAGTVSTTALSATNLQFPEGLAASPDGRTLYVANASDDSITEIDLSTAGYPQRTLPLVVSGTASTPYTLQAPAGLAVSPDGSTLYIANFGVSPSNGFIAQVALASGATSTLAYTGSPSIDNPTGLAVTATSLYVANHGGQNVLQVSLGTSSAPLAYYANSSSPINPWDVLLTSSGTVYVTDNEASTLGSFNTNSGVLDPASYRVVGTALGAPTGATEIGSYLYIASYQNKAIYKVDPSSGAIVDTLNVTPHQPFFLANDGTHLFFTDGNDGSVDEIVQP
ncbi:MAG: hypothetical protein KGJ64_05800 [Betaproteobacteria bacterium]|nr:hypothetical protein [Betaproteobacteria bacterium]